MAYLKAIEIAKDLGIAKITVLKYIEEGFLPAQLTYNRKQPYFVVDEVQYLDWKNKHFRGFKRGTVSKSNRLTKDLTVSKIKELIYEWIDWCLKGKLNGKPIVPRTAEIYDYYFGMYLNKLGSYPAKPIVSINNVRQVLGLIPVTSYSTRINVYSSVMSFAKYLIENDLLDKDFIARLRTLRPKRLLPAKKTSLNELQLNQLIESIDKISGGSTAYDRLTSKAIIIFLANTGLRAFELCKLKLKDVDLEAGRVFVKLGKGNKDRIVGINQQTREILLEYLKERMARFDSEYLFINKLGSQFDRDALSRKIHHLAKRIGFQNISPHSLRRSFVTINANKGKSLNHLRIACGHSDISTTQSYCMTSVDEVVEAMRNW
jgi:integrase/recombinase XerD